MRVQVSHIKANTKIPVLGHADGICHIYVDAAADIKTACSVVLDSKVRPPPSLRRNQRSCLAMVCPSSAQHTRELRHCTGPKPLNPELINPEFQLLHPKIQPP